MSYKQLTLEQRYEIPAYLKAGFNRSQIAQKLDVHKSTISRELARNSGQRGYRTKQAQSKTNSRRQEARKSTRFTAVIQAKVESLLNEDWSPEQISGYMKSIDYCSISHERIYQHIWADKQAGGSLYKRLRHSQKKRRKRYGKKDSRGQIKGRTSIAERPNIVDEKTRIGDWEIDTVIGKNHNGALVTAVERITKFSCIAFVPSRKADLVAAAIIRILKPFKNRVHTITADNGKEFAMHTHIAERLDAKVYFADPYSSWQRGLNENTNGLIRQYFPKKTPFVDIKERTINYVVAKLNNRPRKTLNFKTPYQAFFENKSVALGT